MSRIAKNSIKIDQDISCKFESGSFHAKGKLGEMNLFIDPSYMVDIKENEIVLPYAHQLPKSMKMNALAKMTAIQIRMMKVFQF